ncbi:flotillin-2-like [Portunus trituberculatus]|uniref:flotillin-2-like n=1 Tax=Portunus trituberculatus TaxID=210409 RepID=UPI001E1CE892|nr:flotillin-2-like [Portunus trituberculatus]
MGNIHTVGPNEALVVSGGCCGATSKKTIVGGWAWAWWFVTDVQRLSLEVITLNPRCENVETSLGVQVTVTGVAQVKVMKEEKVLKIASEQFLGMTPEDIRGTILMTLEGHLRAILATLTVEEVYQDRDQFAQLVREVAGMDVGRMGIEILSFTIKDVYDRVDYLSSLGKSQTAAVKRDADIGVAQANRDAGIREAENEKTAMDVKYTTDTKIEDNARLYKLQKAQFDREINTAKAEAQLAYELQAAKTRQKIRNEEIAIEVVERRKQIEVEEGGVSDARVIQEKRWCIQKPVSLRDTAVLSNLEKNYLDKTSLKRVWCLLNKQMTVEAARADAERIKRIGEAEAYSVEAVGKAEAESMKLKAQAYKQYGEAAIMSMVLDSLPQIAAEVAAPLAKTEEIVMVGGGDTMSNAITKMCGELPPAVHALTGVDLTKVLGKVPGATVTQPTPAPRVAPTSV